MVNIATLCPQPIHSLLLHISLASAFLILLPTQEHPYCAFHLWRGQSIPTFISLFRIPWAKVLLHDFPTPPSSALKVHLSSMQGFPATHSVLARSLDLPIVGPLVNFLVGGGANGGGQPSTSPAKSPSDNPPPGSPPSGNPPSGNPPPGNPPPGTTIGSGDSNGNGGESNPTNFPIPTSGGGAAFQPVSPVSSKTTPISTPGNPSSSSSAQNANGGTSTPSSSSPGGGGSHPVSSGQAASAMAGSPSSTSLAVLGTNFLEASQSSLGSGSSTVGALTPSSTTPAATSTGERLSGGTIAGITIMCLFSLLALILLVFRRRSIARRVELRNRWWFNRTRGGSFFPTSGPHSPIKANGEVSASRLSARSSFATNFDQGLMFRVDPPSRLSLGAVPDYPPMAEVRERNSVLISTGATVARKNSMNSMLTRGSDPDTQYLAVSTSQNNLEPFTPMSVRPFSPSESFFFPKPPAPSARDSFFFPGTQGHTSGLSSASTLVQVSTPPRAFMIDLLPTSAANPTPGAALSPLTAADNSSPDPFADPVKPEFAEIEVIRRPFAPSLHDELMVYLGDHVRIFQIFDDGWAFVEKLAGMEGRGHERGLIPLDCLREADQPLPTFLAQKRISYGSDQPIGCAL